jgi:Nucleotidyl transferase AbiEii toxin, Type IV TA system
MAASVRQRLLNIARDRQEDFQLVLSRFALERLLFRLSRSQHRDAFTLKGAMLFQFWGGEPHRPTRDLDLLGRGEPSTEQFEQVFQEVCRQPAGDDGLVFRDETVRAEQIKEDDEYQGLRIRLEARLGSARIPIQIDVGFGDAVTPGPQEITFPTLLDFPAPVIQAYPRETVVAEKFQAMVMLGIANSRMKDFYDLWMLAGQFEFQGPILCDAIHATFDRRKTTLPVGPPLALTSEFAEDSGKQTQW